MAPLIAFPLIILGLSVLFGGAMAVAWRLQRARMCTWPRFAVSVALFVPAVPVILWSSTWASAALVIVLAYGYDAYYAGLWIINKHGDLSDGRRLEDVWHGIWGALMFLSYAWPNLPLMVFRFVTDRHEERCAETGEAYYRLGKVRQHHGDYAAALEAYRAAVAHLTNYLESVAQSKPTERPEFERAEQAREYLQDVQEGIKQCEDRLSEVA